MTAITAARIASVPMVRGCPAGCDGQHNRDCEGNFLHRGPLAVAAPPESSAGRVLKAEDPKAPCLTAHLVVPDGPEFADEAPHVAVDGGDLFGPYAELDADQAAEFIDNLKAFTASVEQMRARLLALMMGDRS